MVLLNAILKTVLIYIFYFFRHLKLSLRGIMILLNAILKTIQIYMFSFFKAPKVILEEIIKLQRTLLWGGVAGFGKINRVSWERICMAKEEDGLGFKNCELFNQALITKWCQRKLIDPKEIWFDFITFGYDNIHSILLDGAGVCKSKLCFLWWKDLRSVYVSYVNGQNGFLKTFVVSQEMGELLISGSMCDQVNQHDFSSTL